MIFKNIDSQIVFDNLNIRKKKLSILNLIKNVQEFNLLCRQIFSQLCEKSEKNLLFILIKNEILRKMNHVFVSQQKIIQVWLLELYHDCSSNSHWDRDKILELIQHHFIWNEIVNDIHVYVTMCLIYQSKAIHHHKSYSQLEPLSVLKNIWNSSFKEISLD